MSAVKALVLAGVGVGQLLPFMLNAEERADLVCAESLPHDPDCGIYAVRSFRALSDEELTVQAQLIDELSRILAAQATA